MPSVENREPINVAGSKAQFLSDITGLPIVDQTLLPELALGYERDENDVTRAHTFKVVLGEEGDQYLVDCNVSFPDEWNTRGTYTPDVEWYVSYNGELLNNGEYLTGGSVFPEDLKDPDIMNDVVLDHLRQPFGGPDTEVAFMDYEYHTLEGLKGDESYFSNIYLTVMTHMKERGLEMPPILSKDESLRRAMKLGDTKEVGRLLSAAQVAAKDVDPRIQAHIRYESNVIREETEHNHTKRNPFVPLEQGFPYMQFEEIEEGDAPFGRLNILAMQNDLHSGTTFPNQIAAALRKDGRFAGSKVFHGFQIGELVRMGETGKVSIVVFDQLEPDLWELPYLQGGSSPQAVFSSDGDFEFKLGNGKHLSREEMEDAVRSMDMRQPWMDTLATYCKEMGTEVPPHITIRTRQGLGIVAKMIAASLPDRDTGK